MEKILIIGGTSFIAQIFIEDYSNKYEFSSITRKPTKNGANKVYQNFFDINISDFKCFDSVINFAAIVHNPKSVKSEDYYKINYDLAIRNANLAREAGVKQFVQISSIAVYGNTQEIGTRTKEDPINDYGRSKQMADAELLKLQSNEFKITILRPSMVYGGGKSPGNMLKLISLVKKGIPLPFKGVHNSRQFLNVHQLNYFIHYSVQKKLTGIYVLADKKGVSTNYLISVISDKLQVKNRQMGIPILMLKVLKKFTPGMYNKLFGNLIIELPELQKMLLEKNNWNLENGVEEMIDKRL